jgi:methylmalonyl-CoA mutase cobalamin-binding subunit
VTATALVGTRPTDSGRTVVLGTVASDAHTWNLVYLQLLLEESGHRVVNLGACVPEELFAQACRRHRPDLVVVSTVNGHGYTEGRRLAGVLRAESAVADVPVVIGGKLVVDARLTAAQVDALLAAGFSAVFDDRTDRFLDYVRRLELVEAGRPA